MRFHETKDISQNFSGIITLGFCEVAKYFVNFRFCFRYFQKMTAKFQFHLNRFEILKFQIWRWQNLKKVDIAFTLCNAFSSTNTAAN